MAKASSIKCQHFSKIFVSLKRKILSKVMKFTEKHIYLQRFLAKTSESLGLVNARIHTGQWFSVCSRRFVCLIFQYGWLRQKSNTYILVTEIFVSIIVYVLMELSSILAGPKEHNLVHILSIKH